MWRTVLVQKPARLSLHHRQLRCENEDGINQVALEDIAWIILETPQTSITGALLSQLATAGVGVMTCDDKHLPNGVLMPFMPHHRQLSQLELQLSWSEPFRKRCWQQLVIAKIENQAAHLAQHGLEEAAEQLRYDAQHVLSGDTDNREAVSAKRYWQALFGNEFRRKGGSGTTAALNYGYALVRACIGRSLVAGGLLPTRGLHHQGQLNSWNLADDLMEPYRPLVDQWIVHLAEQAAWGSELTVVDRQQIVTLLNQSVKMGDETVNLLTAGALTVDSLVRASRERSPHILRLPVLSSGLQA